MPRVRAACRGRRARSVASILARVSENERASGEGGEPERRPERSGSGELDRDGLFGRVYEELHEQASSYLRDENVGHTLQPTALVHEAWIKLSGQDRLEVNDREHFLALAAMAMRRILVDHARGRRRRKRGGSWNRLDPEQIVVADAGEDDAPDLVAVDEALRKLQAMSESRAKIVEMRFFGGLSGAEIARVLGISESTVKREWRMARALMTRLLEPDGPDEPGEPSEPGEAREDEGADSGAH